MACGRSRWVYVVTRSALYVTIILAVAALVVIVAPGCGPAGRTTSTALSSATLTSPNTTVPASSGTDTTNSSNQNLDATLFPIVVHGKWGYIDRKGSVVVAPRFDAAAAFCEGLGCIRVGDEETGKYGFVDASGALVIEPKFAWAGDFSEGLSQARLTQGGKTGYIDKSGAWVIKPRFQNAGQFSEGLAPAQVEGNDLFGCIDKTGTFVIQPTSRNPIYFSEALAAAEGPMTPGVRPKEGYLDKTGSWAIEPRFYGAQRFSGGLAFEGLSQGTGEEFAYIDTSGNIVFTLDRPQEEPNDAYPFFSEGLAVWYGEDGREGFINSKGSFVIRPEFARVTPFSEGLAAVSMDTQGNWGYTDKSGAWAIDPQFAFAYPFSDGLARVVFATPGSHPSGYIDPSGKVIWRAP